MIRIKNNLPSSSNVANVNRFSLLLRQDSGIPLLDTVVNGTRQSIYWMKYKITSATLIF